MYEGLKDVGHLEIFRKYPDSDPSWFGFLMTVKESAPFSRNDLTAFLEQHRIQTRNLFAGNLLKHPCFETLTENTDYRVAGKLTNTDRIMNRSFWIGLYPGMSEAKLNYMISRIREFCR